MRIYAPFLSHYYYYFLLLNLKSTSPNNFGSYKITQNVVLIWKYDPQNMWRLKNIAIKSLCLLYQLEEYSSNCFSLWKMCFDLFSSPANDILNFFTLRRDEVRNVSVWWHAVYYKCLAGNAEVVHWFYCKTSNFRSSKDTVRLVCWRVPSIPEFNRQRLVGLCGWLGIPGQSET